MDCGDAGHILLSNHIAEDLAQYRHWQPHLHDLGECEVKHGLRVQVFNLHKHGLGNPATPAKFVSGKRRTGLWSPRGRPRIWLIATLVSAGVVLVGGLWIFLRHETKNPVTAISEKSIAVLPFENRSEEKANAYFADGVQDEILTRLSKIADLKVISRTSTQHYKSA